MAQGKPVFASEAKHGILDAVGSAPAKVGSVLRWEILEIVERDGVLIKSQLYRPLGEPDDTPDAYRLPFHPDNDISKLISAALFDGFEPVSHSVIGLPDGSLQQHWIFRLQVVT